MKSKFISNFFYSKIDQEYIKFNKKIFKNKTDSKKFILYELNWRESDIIASGFLLERLSKIHNASKVAFSPKISDSFFINIKNFFFKIINRKIYKINESLGIKKYIFPKLNKLQKKDSIEKYNKYKNKMYNKDFYDSLKKKTNVDINNFKLVKYNSSE